MTLISKLRKLNASMILYDKNNLHSDFFFMQYKIVYVNRWNTFSLQNSIISQI